MKHHLAHRFLRSPVSAALLAVSLAALAFTPASNAATTTGVTVSAPSQAAPGSQFSASVVVAPAAAIAGMQFDLTFDPSLVSATSVQEGNLFSQAGAATFFNPGTIDNNAGTITGVFGAITSPGQTVSAQGTFATIAFTAKSASGDCPLGLLNVIVGNASGTSVVVTVSSGSVTIANHAPVLAPIGNKVGAEGSAMSFTVSATDADGDSLTYSASVLPSGAAFDAASRTFSWTPTYDQSGTYTIRFQVTDGSSSDYEDITITVGNMLRKDVNDDGSVNVLDMIRVGQHWNETGPAGWIREDINEDGSVNVLDATLIGQGWTG
jgi:hypothetical protein